MGSQLLGQGVPGGGPRVGDHGVLRIGDVHEDLAVPVLCERAWGVGGAKRGVRARRAQALLRPCVARGGHPRDTSRPSWQQCVHYINFDVIMIRAEEGLAPRPRRCSSRCLLPAQLQRHLDPLVLPVRHRRWPQRLKPSAFVKFDLRGSRHHQSTGSAGPPPPHPSHSPGAPCTSAEFL